MSVAVSRLLSGALAVGVLGVVLVGAPGASAAVSTLATCSPKANISQSGGTVVGRGYTICRGLPGGEPVQVYDDDVAVQRVDPNTGVWYTLANGVGTATYACLGTATNTFRAVTPDRVSASITVSCG